MTNQQTALVAERGADDRPNGFYTVINPISREVLAKHLSLDAAQEWSGNGETTRDQADKV